MALTRSSIPESLCDKSERRVSGYGVSTEELIISDDDTESVESDKASTESHYSDDDDFSVVDSDQDESEYENDGNTGAMDGQYSTTSAQIEESEYGKNAKKQMTTTGDIWDAQRLKLPSVMSLVAASSKFSIGSLMNDTLDALGTKHVTDKEDLDMKNPGSSVGINGEQKEETADRNDGKDEQGARVEGADQTPLGNLTNPEETLKLSSPPPLFIEVDSESDTDEAPEELDAKGRSYLPNSQTDTDKMLEKPLQEEPSTVVAEPSKPVLQADTTTVPPSAVSFKLKAFDSIDAGKTEWKKLNNTVLMNSTMNGDAYQTSPTPLKDAYRVLLMNQQHHLRKQHQLRIATLMRPKESGEISPDDSSKQTPSQFTPAPVRLQDATDSLQPAPLPWVHSCFAPSNASTPQQTESLHHQESPTRTQPSHPFRVPHLFERILSSDEAKARSAKLEKIKAALREHRSKTDVSFNPWGIAETAFPFCDGGSDVALNETTDNIFSTRVDPITIDDSYLVPHVGVTKPRGFSISNLVHDQPGVKPVPVGVNWIAEKTLKERNEDTTMSEVVPSTEDCASTALHGVMSSLPPSYGTKRKYDETMYEDMAEDKILQEAPSVEEKIQCAGKPEEKTTVDDVVMRDASEEKEIYEEVLPNQTAVISTVTETIDVVKTPNENEDQQPTPKRARTFTTGFALGAVTGAVGVFAALVASAP